MSSSVGTRCVIRWLLVNWSYRVVRAASGVSAVGVYVVSHGSLLFEFNDIPIAWFQDGSQCLTNEARANKLVCAMTFCETVGREDGTAPSSPLLKCGD